MSGWPSFELRGTVAARGRAAGRRAGAPVDVARRRCGGRVRRAGVLRAAPPLAWPHAQRTHGGAGTRGRGDPDGAVPEGALMQRAAAGLAVAISRPARRVYAARVLLLVGAGDNGGDALWAGAMLARRGAAVEAVLLSSKVHAEGLGRAAGRTAAAPYSPPRPTAPTSWSTGSSASAGARDCATRQRARWPCSKGCRSSRSTCPRASTSTPGSSPDRHVRADLTVTFGTHKIAHLVDPAAQACGVVHLVDIGLDLPEAPVEALQPVDVAALLPIPGPFGAQVHPRRRRRTRRVGDLPRRRGAVHVRRRLRPRRDGALLGLGRRLRARAAPGDRRLRGARAGLGGRLRRRHRRRGSAGRRALPTGSPRWSTPTR